MPTAATRSFALFTFALAAASGAYAQLPPFPQALSFPSMPAAAQGGRSYAQHEFILRDRTVTLRGRMWSTDFDYAAAQAGDARAALGAIVGDLQKSGWEVVLRDEPRNPPLATLKHRREGRELWAQVEVKETARIIWLEPGLPSVRLTLPTPAVALLTAAAGAADFPLLPAYPASRLLGSARDEAAGTWVKEYASPPGATALEVATVYLDALKVAGWEVVEDMTGKSTGANPLIVACWVRDGIEVWTRIEVRAGSHSIELSTTPLG